MGWGWGYCSWSALIYNADISARVMSLVSALYFCGRGRFITQHRGIKLFLLLTPLLWCKGPRPPERRKLAPRGYVTPPPGLLYVPFPRWGLVGRTRGVHQRRQIVSKAVIEELFKNCTVLKPHSKKRCGESVEEHNTHTASIEKQMVPTVHPHLTARPTKSQCLFTWRPK